MSFKKLLFCVFTFLAITSCVLVQAESDVISTDEVEKPNSRSKRAVGDDPKPKPNKLSMDGFVNVTDCLYLFSAGGKALVYTYDVVPGKAGAEIKYQGSYAFKLPAKPSSTSGSECASNSDLSRKNPKVDISQAKLKLNYNKKDLKSTNISSVDIELIIDVNDYGRNWSLVKGSVAKGNVEGSNIVITSDLGTHQILLKQSGVVSASTFSFSCLSMQFVSPAATNQTLQTIKLNFDRFQLQPYTKASEKPTLIFYASFDCSTWMTIATWAGLITVILFTAIVAIGVYFLFDIKTPDRFENPKGKTITVAVGE